MDQQYLKNNKIQKKIPKGSRTIETTEKKEFTI